MTQLAAVKLLVYPEPGWLRVIYHLLVEIHVARERVLPDHPWCLLWEGAPKPYIPRLQVDTLEQRKLMPSLVAALLRFAILGPQMTRTRRTMQSEADATRKKHLRGLVALLQKLVSFAGQRERRHVLPSRSCLQNLLNVALSEFLPCPKAETALPAETSK